MKKKTNSYRYGGVCLRKSVSIPEELWEWCERRAEKREISVSAYIVRLIKKGRAEYEKRNGISPAA